MYVMTNGMMVIPGKFKPADWRLEACVSTRPTKSNGVQSAAVPIRGRSSSDDTREQAAKCMASRHGRACFVPSHPGVGVPNILVSNSNRLIIIFPLSHYIEKLFFFNFNIYKCSSRLIFPLSI